MKDKKTNPDRPKCSFCEREWVNLRENAEVRSKFSHKRVKMITVKTLLDEAAKSINHQIRSITVRNGNFYKVEKVRLR